jgi:hypothetical protein
MAHFGQLSRKDDDSGQLFSDVLFSPPKEDSAQRKHEQIDHTIPNFINLYEKITYFGRFPSIDHKRVKNCESNACQYPIPALFLSHTHFAIEYSENNFYLIDYSRNGTYIRKAIDVAIKTDNNYTLIGEGNKVIIEHNDEIVLKFKDKKYVYVFSIIRSPETHQTSQTLAASTTTPHKSNALSPNLSTSSNASAPDNIAKDYEDLQNQNVALTQQVAQLLQKLADIENDEGENERILNQANELTALNLEYKSDIEFKNSEIARLTSEMDQIGCANYSLMEENRVNKTKIDDLSDQISALQSELVMNNQDFKEEKGKLIQKIDELVNQKEEIMKIIELNKSKDQQLSDMQVANEALKDIIKEMQVKEDELTRSINTIKDCVSIRQHYFHDLILQHQQYKQFIDTNMAMFGDVIAQGNEIATILNLPTTNSTAATPLIDSITTNPSKIVNLLPVTATSNTDSSSSNSEENESNSKDYMMHTQYEMPLDLDTNTDSLDVKNMIAAEEIVTENTAHTSEVIKRTPKKFIDLPDTPDDGYGIQAVSVTGKRFVKEDALYDQLLQPLVENSSRSDSQKSNSSNSYKKSRLTPNSEHSALAAEFFQDKEN